jgi:hypothetical protein
MHKGIWLGALLASTAIGATPALAQDAGGSSDNAAEIQMLRQQVQEMQARLDKLEAAPPPAPAPAPVMAVAPASSAVPGWIANTTIGGKAYLNLSYLDQKVNGVPQKTNGTQAELKRFYLTVDHKFSDIFSANLTTDVRYGSNGLTNDDAIYVKKAFLQAKFSPAFFVRLGAADMPWIPFVEDVYGYRFVENTLIDRTKYGTSSDWGLHIGGTFGNGLVSYAASAVGGQGYKTIYRGTNTVDLEGRLSVVPMKGLTFAVGGYTGKLGKSVESAVDTPHRASRLDALAAYATGPIRVGLEYFSAKDWNNVTTAYEDKTSGWSAFGSVAFAKKFSVFGRYDWVNPNKYTDPAGNEDYFNVGVDYTGVKNIDIALVYKRDKADDVAIASSNGTIGCSGTASAATGCVGDGTYDEIGVWTQLKF